LELAGCDIGSIGDKRQYRNWGRIKAIGVNGVYDDDERRCTTVDREIGQPFGVSVDQPIMSGSNEVHDTVTGALECSAVLCCERKFVVVAPDEENSVARGTGTGRFSQGAPLVAHRRSPVPNSYVLSRPQR